MNAAHQTPSPAGILLSAADPALMREAIDSVVAAGIPVVTIDADSPKSTRRFFVGTNNYQAGQMGGELLVRELNGKGTVVGYSIPGQENLDERLEGYKRAIARQPGIKLVKVIVIRGEPAKAFDATRGLIDKKTIPDAFACLEALSCAEVADVLDRANIRGKTVVAMDTNDTTLAWIQKGMIRDTIAQKPFHHGVLRPAPSMTCITTSRFRSRAAARPCLCLSTRERRWSINPTCNRFKARRVSQKWLPSSRGIAYTWSTAKNISGYGRAHHPRA
jgi:hypothetical protein